MWPIFVQKKDRGGAQKVPSSQARHVLPPPSSAVEIAAAPECAPQLRAAPPLEEELVPGPEQQLRQQFRINYHLPDPEPSIPVKWPGVFEPLQVTL